MARPLYTAALEESSTASRLGVTVLSLTVPTDLILASSVAVSLPTKSRLQSSARDGQLL